MLVVILSVRGACAQQVATTTVNDLYQNPTPATASKVSEDSVTTAEAGESTEQIALNSLKNKSSWVWKVGALAGVSYNSNINSAAHGQADGVFLQNGFVDASYGNLGSPLMLKGRYTLGYREFASHGQYDGFSNDLALNLDWTPTGKLSFTSDLNFLDGRGSTMGAGVQNPTSSLNYNLVGRYQFDDKISTGCALAFDTLLESNGGSSNYYNGTGTWFLDYQVGPKGFLGLAAGSGVRSLNGTEIDSNFGVHGSYTPLEKLTFNADIGLGLRSFSSGQNDLYPRVQIETKYKPREGTNLKFSLFNLLSSGYYSNSINAETQTGFTLGISQQLFQKFTLNLYGGYELESTSSSVLSSSSSTGGDSLFGASLGYTVFRYVDLTLFSNGHISRLAGETGYNQFVTGLEIKVTF